MANVTQTTNFSYNYADGLNAADKAAAIAHANALAETCENDLVVLESMFGVSGGFGPSNRVTIVIDTIDGLGDNFGYRGDNKINIVPFTDYSDGDAATRAVFVAEMAEILMDYRNQKTGVTTWVANNSMGEALSTVCEATLHPEGYYTATVNGGYGVRIDQWLNSPRADWVNHNENTDRNFASFGCGILFIYYLQSQLGFSMHDIITKAGNTLAKTYTNLTGNADGWTPFITSLNAHFPVGTTFNPVSDNLFPFPNLATFYSPNKITCGYSATTLISIDKPAKAEVIIQLASDDSALVSVPSTVTIPIGSLVTSVLMQAAPIPLPFSPKFVNVHASYAGKSLPTSVEVVPPAVSKVALSPDTVVCGNSSIAIVTLDHPSKSGPVLVDLISSAPGFATVPAQLTIPENHPSWFVIVSTPQIQIPFTTAHAEIWASYSGTSANATLTVEPKVIAGILSSLSVLPATIQGGNVSHGTVTLVQAVPTDTLVGLAAVEPGTHFPLPGSESSVASVPPSVTIPAGRTSAGFLISTKRSLSSTSRKATIIAGAVVTKYVELTVTG